ncbi:MAG: type III pantothenate kinase [Bacteroidales bacterium]|jgi:type III pantothenate kinase
MKLVLDIGNSFIKAGVFEKSQLMQVITAIEINTAFIDEIISRFGSVNFAIISSVREVPAEINNYLKNKFRVLEFTSTLSLPIKSYYKTPITLGKDRLAGVVAAHFLYPGKNILVIDAGTCITYDLINKNGEYFGGSISPGLTIRFNALHTFTGKLPLVSFKNYNELTGTDTETSILAGVINGFLFEVDSVIDKYKEQYDDLKVLICGGDYQFLADRLKNSIFAVPELVLIGLNEILDYNES